MTAGRNSVALHGQPIFVAGPNLAQRIGLICVVICGLCLNACSATRPTVKIGLIAPFEGAQRSLGYEVLGAVKLALAERNAAGGAGGYGIELVALNDDGDPAAAARQVRALAVDPGVTGVLGPWQTSTARAAAPELAAAGLPAVVPAALPDADLEAAATVFRLFAGDQALAAALAAQVPAGADVRVSGERTGWPEALIAGLQTRSATNGPQVRVLSMDAVAMARALAVLDCQTSIVCLAGPEAADPLVAERAGAQAGAVVWVTSLAAAACDNEQAAFCTAYTAHNGVPPGRFAAAAYVASSLLLDAIQAAAQDDTLSRRSVAAALQGSQTQVLGNRVQFDRFRSWQEAPALLEQTEVSKRDDEK